MRLFIRAGLLHADGTILDIEEGMEDEYEALEYEEGAEGYKGGADIHGDVSPEEKTPAVYAGGEEACQLLRDRLDFDEVRRLVAQWWTRLQAAHSRDKPKLSALKMPPVLHHARCFVGSCTRRDEPVLPLLTPRCCLPLLSLNARQRPFETRHTT